MTALEVLAWLVLIGWAVATTVYQDHRSLQLRITRLTRPAYSIAQDNEWAIITNSVMSIPYLKQPFGQQQPPGPCALKITAPSSNRVPAQILVQEARMFGCTVSSPDNLVEDIDSARQEEFGALPNSTIVHGGVADPRVDGFAVDLSNVFEVKKAHDFNPTENSGLIWVQFGPGNVWRKGN